MGASKMAYLWRSGLTTPLDYGRAMQDEAHLRDHSACLLAERVILGGLALAA